MKAVRIHGFDAVPVLEDVADPVPRLGRSIVRMQAATVGHIDRTVWRGSFLRHPPFPYTPGVEAAGIVVASERYAAGQRVWLRGSGLGTLFDGTWCEQIDAPDEALGLLPDAITMALGSAFFSPTTSAWVALHEVAKLQPGEQVLVTGASGAVGSLVMQLACDAGCDATARRWRSTSRTSCSAMWRCCRSTCSGAKRLVVPWCRSCWHVWPMAVCSLKCGPSHWPMQHWRSTGLRSAAIVAARCSLPSSP